METKQTTPASIDAYIEGFPPEIQSILREIRRVVRGEAPDAQEGISYQIPTFKLHGPLVHFAAFKRHIGFYPPVRGDAGLERDVAPYAGEKGNLRFPLDQPIPYDLIARITRLRVAQNAAQAGAKAAAKAAKAATDTEMPARAGARDGGKERQPCA